MKVCVVLLKVVLVVVLVEVAAGASTGSAERVCPPEASDDLKLPIEEVGSRFKISIFDKVVNVLGGCLVELRFPNLIKNESTTTEDLHRMFDVVCQKKQRLEECLSEKATNLEVCPDPTILKVFNMLREFLVRKFESGCDHNAERFVRLFSGTTKPDKQQLRKCMLKMHTTMRVLGDNDVDISSQLVILHKRMIEFKECFSAVELDAQVREEVDYFIDETITTMQCIHPQDGSIVTCASLDPALVNFTNICDVKTQHNTLNLYDVLEHDVFSWFGGVIAQDNHEVEEEDFTTDNEKLREDFKDFCSAISRATNYFNRVQTEAQMCFKVNEDQDFNLLIDNVKSALEGACTEDGKHLSDVMFEVYRLKRTSPDHSHAVLKCIEDATSTRKDSDEHRSSSKNMRLYHELETFKECFMNKIREDQTSVDAATSLINGILGMVKCINPEDGSTVLCASLMHDHSHSHTH